MKRIVKIRVLFQKKKSASKSSMRLFQNKKRKTKYFILFNKLLNLSIPTNHKIHSDIHKSFYIFQTFTIKFYKNVSKHKIF